jgi:hypothetical protein
MFQSSLGYEAKSCNATSTILIRRESRSIEKAAVALLKVALQRQPSQDFDLRYQQWLEDNLGRYGY